MTSPDQAPATPAARSGSRGLVLGSVAVVLAVAAGGTAYYVRTADAGPAARQAAATSSPSARPVVAQPVAAVAGLGADGSLPLGAPLVVSVTDGTLVGVTGTGPAGAEVAGTVGTDGTWTATAAPVPSTTYQLVADVRDGNGESHQLPVSATTGAPTKTTGVTLLPGDNAVVGAGQAVSVRLATAVTDKATRAEVERHLTVTTTPAVVGSWRWMSSTELRYRGADYWPTGTKISVAAALNQVQLAPGVWGTARTSTFSVGDTLSSVVDVAAHTMTVSLNGTVVRVMKASMGKPGFDTRNGNFVVLEKFADRVMDSATVDLPPGTPAYKTAVKDAVRITNSGTFTHGAPWSVSSQGRRNVSHGCVNLSPADAHWYYLGAKRGDVVDGGRQHDRPRPVRRGQPGLEHELRAVEDRQRARLTRRPGGTRRRDDRLPDLPRHRDGLLSLRRPHGPDRPELPAPRAARLPRQGPVVGAAHRARDAAGRPAAAGRASCCRTCTATTSTGSPGGGSTRRCRSSPPRRPPGGCAGRASRGRSRSTRGRRTRSPRAARGCGSPPSPGGTPRPAAGGCCRR